MTKNNLYPYPRVIVMTSDKYIEVIKPFAYLFNRYWRLPDNLNPDVLVAGFTPPDFWDSMPENFSFVSIGDFSDYPWEKWSDALLALLEELYDEAFVLMLEDYWITRPVDARAVKILYDYIIQFKNVLKVDLTGDRLYAYGADLDFGHVSYIDLVKSMPGSDYHMSLMTGLWRRDHLLRLIVPGESPHEVEMVGTPRVSHDKSVDVLGTRQWPIRHTLAFRGQDTEVLLLNELDENDVKSMRELGLLDPWEKND